MKLKCIIVDDEPMARKLLEEYIDDVGFLQLAGTAENPVKAQSLINEVQADLLFLDINMPKMNGIEFLRISRSLPPVILTTAYTEYATDGFELDVLDYLVKPFSFERFFKAACKAKEYADLRHGNIIQEVMPVQDFFFVKCNGKIEKLFYNELVYVEAMLNYVVLHTETRKLVVYLTIKGIMDQLPEQTFLKIHKSTIVNMDKIKSIEGNGISAGNARLIISQAMQETVMKAILKDKMMKR